MTTPRRRSLHEAHTTKTEARAPDETSPSPGMSKVKRSFNEAAHKLGYVAPRAPSAAAQESEAAQKRFDALADNNRDVITQAGRAVLVLGALGIVYGDIGTSHL